MLDTDKLDITYYTKNVYGQQLRYPVSKDAIMVCRLAETKTLTDWVMLVLNDNEADIKEVLKPQSILDYYPRKER